MATVSTPTPAPAPGVFRVARARLADFLDDVGELALFAVQIGRGVARGSGRHTQIGRAHV